MQFSNKEVNKEGGIVNEGDEHMIKQVNPMQQAKIIGALQVLKGKGHAELKTKRLVHLPSG